MSVFHSLDTLMCSQLSVCVCVCVCVCIAMRAFCSYIVYSMKRLPLHNGGGVQVQDLDCSAVTSAAGLSDRATDWSQLSCYRSNQEDTEPLKGAWDTRTAHV